MLNQSSSHPFWEETERPIIGPKNSRPIICLKLVHIYYQPRNIDFEGKSRFTSKLQILSCELPTSSESKNNHRYVITIDRKISCSLLFNLDIFAQASFIILHLIWRAEPHFPLPAVSMNSTSSFQSQHDNSPTKSFTI